MKSIVALFEDPRAVERAVHDLLTHGIPVDHINAVCPVEPDVARRIELQDRSDPIALAPLAHDTDLGHVLEDAGFLDMPLGGAMLAVGPRLGPMASPEDPLGTGIAALPRHLRAAGVPALDAECYAEAVSRGAALVMLTVHEVYVDDAAEILTRHEPIEPGHRPVPPLLSTSGPPFEPSLPGPTMGSRP